MLLSRLLELPDSAEVRPNSLGLIRATHLLARNMRFRRSRQDEKIRKIDSSDYITTHMFTNRK